MKASINISCIFFFVVVFFIQTPQHTLAIARPHALNLFTQSLALVTPPPLLLPYHNGPLLTGSSQLNVYIIWYGKFSASQKSIIKDFIASFSSSTNNNNTRSLSLWWSATTGYKDSFGQSVFKYVKVAGEISDETLTMGKTLKTTDVEALVVRSVKQKAFPNESKSVYMILTASDVYVDGFCLDSCGFHAYTFPDEATGDKMLPYAWVGNAEKQCPGQCAWPFAVASFGPQTPALIPPNKDVGIDGMVINIATVLAGAATNPFGTGYFQGDAAAPLEAVSACTGIFGKGAYPGYPGELLVHSSTNSSFNAVGFNTRRFLVPAIWNPAALNCIPL